MNKEQIKINPDHDITFDIATGRHRREKHWKNKEMAWSDLVTKASVTYRSHETMSEFMASTKIRQDEIKDIGGFVGGYLNGGRRTPSTNIIHRQLITLDLDHCEGVTLQFILDAVLKLNCAAFIYSTHKHKPQSPRLRLVILLDRPVSTDEYVPLARWYAGEIGINLFDDTTFQPSRLMHWPSTSKDGEYYFKFQDAPPACADDILQNGYQNWRDPSEWPFSDRVGEVIHRDIKKQGDPTEKPGLIGAFCRSYDIHEAIDVFLPDVYRQCDVDDRYTYLAGSTSAGLVVYDDKYTYSHHGTDPTSEQLCNAFDLVRIHLFGLKDDDTSVKTPANMKPSYLAMTDFIAKDPKVRKTLVTERLESCRADFAELDQGEAGSNTAADTDWMSLLDVDSKGNCRRTVDNMLIVLNNDPALKGKFGYDDFKKWEVALGNLPWRKVALKEPSLIDSDDASLRHYFEKAYNLTGVQKVTDALSITVRNNTFHPVRDYLNKQSWDGVKRVENLFIDYLGAEDSIYIRTVTRKAITAAVKRVFEPGCKFDYVLVTVGREGIGKSTVIQKLGGHWFSDTFGGVQGKDSMEQLHGVWIMEIAELAGLRRADVDAVKQFISKTEDHFRVTYGKRVANFPRQVVFFGSTNSHEFLRDTSGNRRFWPVETFITKPTKDFDKHLTPEEVGQIWAEAVQIYKAGEQLYLPKELEETARRKQAEHREVDDRSGAVLKYLDTLLPADWSYRDMNDRRRFLSDPLSETGTVIRDRVCMAEIWCELFGKPQSEMTRSNTKSLHDIMRTMDGWELSKKGAGRFGIYDKQKFYERTPSQNPNIENLIIDSEGVTERDY